MTKKEKYIEYVYNDMVFHTEKVGIHYSIGDCNISAHLNHNTRIPHFAWIPNCVKDILVGKYGVRSDEMYLVWGRYSDFIVETYLEDTF